MNCIHLHKHIYFIRTINIQFIILHLQALAYENQFLIFHLLIMPKKKECLCIIIWIWFLAKFSQFYKGNSNESN